MTARSTTFRLLPVELIARARAQTKAEFIASGRKLFVVSLPSTDGDLANGLAETLTTNGTQPEPSRDALGFRTTVGRLKDVLANPGDDLRKILLRGPHFVAPLCKRPIHGAAFAERISIGRARNNDIVLRQADVSKFHAWLECDEEGEFYVADAHSRNPTTLRGQTVGRDMELLRPRDVLTFGSVQVVYCLAGTLWDVLHEG
jgi:hypothetical protein